MNGLADPQEVPALRHGDRLTQPEFHRRYEAAPEGVKAELLDGIVYIAPPRVRQPHGAAMVELATVLCTYEAATAGVTGENHVTVILGDRSELQPDLTLRISPDLAGGTTVNDAGFIVGPPELVVEVANRDSAAIDLHEKREEYRRAGVPEYLVLCIEAGELRAFDLHAGRELPVDADGVYRSRVFPGLWIDPAAALAGDTRRLLRVLRKGLKSPEHTAFVKKLAAKAARSKPRRPGSRTKRRGQ